MSKAVAVLEETGVFSDAEWEEIVNGLSLSFREAQIVKCLFADESDKRIALDLQMAIPTVRTHMTRLFRKLQANDRADLMLQVFRQFRSGCRQRTCPRI